MGSWGWWASDNDEQFSVGPFTMRQDAIDAAVCDSVYQELDPEPPEYPDWRILIHVVEAYVPTADEVKLSKVSEWMIEHLEENYYEEWLDPDVNERMFDATKEDWADLDERLDCVFREWVAACSIKLQYSPFTQTRNEEIVVLPYPIGFHR